MLSIGIDPGLNETGIVTIKGNKVVSDYEIVDKDIFRNHDFERKLSFLFNAFHHDSVTIGIEMIGHYGTGMPAGKDIFVTCIWIGKFIHYLEKNHIPISMYLRKKVASYFCSSVRAKDSNVRQALIDRYPKIGSGKTPEIGTKKAPGKLYGMKSHMWPALAIAIINYETLLTKNYSNSEASSLPLVGGASFLMSSKSASSAFS